MKIDAVLVRHPWPWRVVYGSCDGWWEVRNAKNETVFDDGSAAGESDEECDDYTRDAILELVEAHVARTATQATHSEECWRWHLDCAVLRIESMQHKETKQ